MEQSPWEANSHSTSHETPSTEPKISLPCSQQPASSLYLETNASSHTFRPYFPKILSNIFPSTRRSSEWSLRLISNDKATHTNIHPVRGIQTSTGGEWSWKCLALWKHLTKKIIKFIFCISKILASRAVVLYKYKECNIQCNQPLKLTDNKVQLK